MSYVYSKIERVRKDICQRGGFRSNITNICISNKIVYNYMQMYDKCLYIYSLQPFSLDDRICSRVIKKRLAPFKDVIKISQYKVCLKFW